MMDHERIRQWDRQMLEAIEDGKRRRRWYFIMKLYALAALVWLITLASAAFSQTVRMEVTVKVVNPADTSLTIEEFGQVREIGSTAWWVKQCCMQSVHRRGILSEECFQEQVKSKTDEPTCEALGVGLIEPAAGE